jgi:hypothetical protein
MEVLSRNLSERTEEYSDLIVLSMRYESGHESNTRQLDTVNWCGTLNLLLKAHRMMGRRNRNTSWNNQRYQLSYVSAMLVFLWTLLNIVVKWE